jgi:hypothetical protein
VQLTTTSGDIEVAGRLDGPGPFAIETVSGDGLLAAAGDVRIEMTSMTGDLQSGLGGQPETSMGGVRLRSGRPGRS